MGIATVGEWQMAIRPGGWIRLTDGKGGPSVYIQYDVPDEPPAGRWDMLTVVMESGPEERVRLAEAAADDLRRSGKITGDLVFTVAGDAGQELTVRAELAEVAPTS